MTLEKAQAMLEEAIEAESKVLISGAEYSITSPDGSVRTVTRASMGLIRNSQRYWQNEVNRLQGGGGIRSVPFIP